MNILKIKYFINVYSGISPSLLASISMGAQIKAKSQIQLAEELKKKSVIQTNSLLQIIKSIDRAWFTKDKFPYYNKPSIISKKQYMTDALTQILILQRFQHITKQFRIQNNPINCLDIGTGHGYMSFVLGRILEKHRLKFNITAIDLFKQSIEMANKIKGEFFRDMSVQFLQNDIDKFIQKNRQSYNVIQCGFYVNEQLDVKLRKALRNKGVGIWPISQKNEQKLFLFKKEEDKIVKEYILTTLFSEQKKVLDESLQRYFVQYDEQWVDESVQQVKVVQERRVNNKKEVEQRLKMRFKELREEFRMKNNRIPTLKQMQQNEQMRNILQELKK